MHKLLSIAVVVYIVCYAFEGPIRYGLHLIGADPLIFLRDAFLVLPMLAIFFHQLVKRRLHPAFLVFAGIVVLHGLVTILNIGNLSVIAYCIKLFITVLAGALCAQFLLSPSRKMLLLLLFIWSANWMGIMLDKYFVDYPWVGMHATIGDVEVDVSQDWQIQGEDKRASGLTRSSINAANIEPLLALVLIFAIPNIPLRLAIAVLTLPALYWTTQKGSLLAYMLTLGLLMLNPRRPIPFLRLGIAIMIIVCAALPLLLSGSTMPHAEGVFSLSSFYLRIESMWPKSWKWIHAREIFPFGVGLGGIGGAQRLYAPNDVNAADNMFLLLYAYFGVMSFIYMGLVMAAAMKVSKHAGQSATTGMAVLFFLVSYGCVITLVEDQMAALFLGAALASIYAQIKSQRHLTSPPVPA
jgi:hypothetical protein